MNECHMGLVVEMVLPPGCFSLDYGMVVQRHLIAAWFRAKTEPDGARNRPPPRTKVRCLFETLYRLFYSRVSLKLKLSVWAPFLRTPCPEDPFQPQNSL
jgi:hypothetical protein